jgi:hypothetical protein
VVGEDDRDPVTALARTERRRTEDTSPALA